MFNECREPHRQFTPYEAREFIHIIDLGPHNIDRVTPDNIKNVIAMGVRELKRIREMGNVRSGVFLPETSNSDLMKMLSERHSKAHAIQCSVNGAEDARSFQQVIASRDSVRAQARDTMLGYLDRTARMGDMLTKLYEVDIMKRVGDIQSDPAYTLNIQTEAAQYCVQILGLLQEFEQANGATIAELSEEDRESLMVCLQNLTSTLTTPPDDEAAWYESVCEPYSDLINFDYHLNKQTLVGSAQELDEIVSA